MTRKGLSVGVIGTIALTACLVSVGVSEAQANKERHTWMLGYVQARARAVALKAQQANVESPPANKIIGGVNALPGDNPFQVALLDKNQPDTFKALFCGGTLIAPDAVVTAAHCSDFVEAAQVQVLTGSQSLASGGVRRDVLKITIHPNWDPRIFDSDVAVWKLATRADGLPVATLATGESPVGATLLATGWGRLTEGGERPILLQKVKLSHVSDTNCNDDNSYKGALTQNMLCAGADVGGRDTCQGDSGGPLTGGSGNSVLTGITSFGIGCGRANLFGVYARVSSEGIRSFILENM